MRYEELRLGLRTGDLVLFSGKGAFSSFIKVLTGGRKSHVALVVVEGDAVLALEATTGEPGRDADTGIIRNGVQLVSLSSKVALYSGQTWVRPLRPGLDESQVAAIRALRHELSGRPYERDIGDLLMSALKWNVGREELSSVFCSELVAEAYQRAGLLHEPPAGRPSDRYVPEDFTEATDLELLGGHRLGPEIPLEA